jgi:hypothetical protein
MGLGSEKRYPGSRGKKTPGTGFETRILRKKSANPKSCESGIQKIVGHLETQNSSSCLMYV